MEKRREGDVFYRVNYGNEEVCKDSIALFDHCSLKIGLIRFEIIQI